MVEGSGLMLGFFTGNALCRKETFRIIHFLRKDATIQARRCRANRPVGTVDRTGTDPYGDRPRKPSGSSVNSTKAPRDASETVWVPRQPHRRRPQSRKPPMARICARDSLLQGWRPYLVPDELRDLVLRQLQDRARQITVGDSKFIQNREVVCLCDRDQ